MTRWLRWLCGAVGILAAGAVGIALACGALTHKPDEESGGLTGRMDREVVVTAASVTSRAVRRTVETVGTLHGLEEVAVTAKVDGRVRRVRRDVGDRVRPGDVLLELDPVDYELAVAEAQRGVELELTRLGLPELPTGEVDFSQVPSVARAQARERNASASLERVRRLNGGAITPEERDNVAKEYAVAQAEYRQAVLEAKATLASARVRAANLATLQQRLADTRLVAPTPVDTAAASSEYVVCTRNVAEGEMVRTMFAADTATLFKLVIDCTLKLKAWVPERHRGEVKVGQEAAVRTESYPGEVFAGRVSRVSPSVDEANRSFQIEITVPNEDHRLSPGGFANVSVLTRADLSAPTVPEEAIVSYAGVTKVYAIVGGVAREFHVRTGQTLEVPDEPGPPHAWVEVVGSLPADATVVTSGQSQLADGVRVRVRGKGE